MLQFVLSLFSPKPASQTDPVSAFFKATAKEKKRVFKRVIRRANNMQREIMDLK